MSGRRLAWWFAGGFALALLLFLPLQLVLPRLSPPPGLSATAISGSLWRGRLRSAEWNGVALGDLRLGLSPLSLFTGRRELWLRSAHARLSLSSGRLRGIDDAEGVLQLPPLAGLALRASLEDAGMLFDAEGCRSAGGRVRLELGLPGNALAPVILSGTPACEGRSGRLVLLPEQPGGPLLPEATLTVEADGGYRLQSLVRSDDPAIRLALLAAGFQDAPGGLGRVDSGRLGPAR